MHDKNKSDINNTEKHDTNTKTRYKNTTQKHDTNTRHKNTTQTQHKHKHKTQKHDTNTLFKNPTRTSCENEIVLKLWYLTFIHSYICLPGRY